MAEGETHSQTPAGSGRETLEYRKVLANLTNIVDTLKVHNDEHGAKKSLVLKCKARKWIDVASDPSPDKLMTIILNRIQSEASTYYEFMDMLGSIEGLDLVKKEIEKPCKYFDSMQCPCNSMYAKLVPTGRN